MIDFGSFTQQLFTWTRVKWDNDDDDDDAEQQHHRIHIIMRGLGGPMLA